MTPEEHFAKGEELLAQADRTNYTSVDVSMWQAARAQAHFAAVVAANNLPVRLTFNSPAKPAHD